MKFQTQLNQRKIKKTTRPFTEYVHIEDKSSPSEKYLLIGNLAHFGADIMKDIILKP